MATGCGPVEFLFGGYDLATKEAVPIDPGLLNTNGRYGGR